MDWTRACRLAASTAVAAAIAIAATATAAPSVDSGAEQPREAAAKERPAPRPPLLPRNFRGEGRWIVRDLGITVPFRWFARHGDVRMVAGGRRHPIWFTNLIYHNTLYTLTYKWPGVTEHPCDQIPGFFNLHILNQLFKTGRFVGREILQGDPRRRVNHWRVGIVLPQAPPGNFLRFPLALGDIYVDQRNRRRFWQVLQFGLQNLYDPALDEWLVMDTFQRGRSAPVRLPARCAPPPA